MLKKIKYYFPFAMVAVLFLFFACRKRKGDCPGNVPQYQQLSASAKEWFPYTGNKIIVFESAAAKRDTLELTNYFLGDDDVWYGDECAMSKGQFLRGNIVDRKSGDTIAAQIGYGDQVLLKKKVGYILYYDAKSLLLLASNSRRFETSITLNNKTFLTVLVFECGVDDKCVSTGITKFYFAKGKGIVAFERNAVLYTLV